MQDINVPSYGYNRLLGNDAQIKAIMDVYDYLRRWKAEVDAVEAAVPEEASASNKLADKNFVNDAITLYLTLALLHQQPSLTLLLHWHQQYPILEKQRQCMCRYP